MGRARACALLYIAAELPRRGTQHMQLPRGGPCSLPTPCLACCRGPPAAGACACARAVLVPVQKEQSIEASFLSEAEMVFTTLSSTQVGYRVVFLLALFLALLPLPLPFLLVLLLLP